MNPKAGAAFDRYHFATWMTEPKPGEEEYLRFVRFGYFVRPSVPWDGRGPIHQKRETPRKAGSHLGILPHGHI